MNEVERSKRKPKTRRGSKSRKPEYMAGRIPGMDPRSSPSGGLAINGSNGEGRNMDVGYFVKSASVYVRVSFFVYYDRMTERSSLEESSRRGAKPVDGCGVAEI